jgi:hypothetical protein
MNNTNKNEMTVQELFDYSINKIVAQGEQCMNSDGDTCVYGNAKNQHCGIGWILDTNNAELMDFGSSISEMAKKYPKLVPTIIKDNLDCFAEIQKFHDTDGVPERRKIALSLRNEFGLNLSNPSVRMWMNLG